MSLNAISTIDGHIDIRSELLLGVVALPLPVPWFRDALGLGDFENINALSRATSGRVGSRRPAFNPSASWAAVAGEVSVWFRVLIRVSSNGGFQRFS